MQDKRDTEVFSDEETRSVLTFWIQNDCSRHAEPPFLSALRLSRTTGKLLSSFAFFYSEAAQR